MKQRLSACFILAGFILTLILVASLATQADEGRLALKGYDPVAYFTDKRAMVGDAQFRYEWDGAIYHFASAKHLELFKAEPERYLPQYNQWCAASVAKGVKVYGNPEWWLVVDDRLYLFGKPIGPELMRKDPAAMKSAADKNWGEVSKLPAPPLPDYMRLPGETQ
jgi:YHS domain-containing protein